VVSGRSTDTKPQGLPIGTIFFETDTGKGFAYDGANWKTITAAFNYSSVFKPSNPIGTTSTTELMMGLGLTITYTPSSTGNIIFYFAGTGTNTVAGDGFTLDLYYGTGTAPSNGNAVAGTLFTLAIMGSDYIGSGSKLISFSQTIPLTGLTIGTAYWFDAGLKAVTGGTASISNIGAQIVEVL
jgi:hypothetical protein